MKVNKKHEVGIVSIMVTMVMLIVISLIVLGFAEISRTEQRNTTDDQLSTEAYYAAESGINDAMAVINNNYNPGQPLFSKPNCTIPTTTPYNVLKGENKMNTIDNVSYTCLIINPTPLTLSVSAKPSSTVIPITSKTKITNLTLNWQLASGSNGVVDSCSNALGHFPDITHWKCNYPVLRVDLLDANGGLARGGSDDWSTDTATMFFVPTFGGSVSTANLSSRGGVFAALCAPAGTSPSCTSTINLGRGGHYYYMRVTTLYKTNSELTISANRGVTFEGAQVVIDSTGKAQDILRRIQVAVDLTDANAFEVPSGALITEDSVCKQFGVAPGIFKVSNSNPNMNNSGSDGDVLCQPN